jgi:radical SAM superfamily enzyme YgiQ (UPF0313 family)
MRVLLIQSYLGGNEPLVFPIGLACLKSRLGAYEVRAFDANASKDPAGDMRTLIGSFAPDVIGISLRNIDSTNKREVVFYYEYLNDALDTIKSCSSAIIVVGGSGFSIYAKEIMENEPRIDFGVYLEGEHTFPDLLGNLDAPENVRSVYYRRNGKLFFTGPAEHMEFSRSSGGPEMGLLPLEDYRGYDDSIGVETKRGCAFNCIYCIYGFLNGRRYRLKDPMAIVDEIERLAREHGAERFMFVDSVFNFPKSHAEGICREIVRRGVRIKWSAWLNEKGLTREFLELIRDAGCDKIMLSPDAFSDDVLARLGKNITCREIVEAYEALRQVNHFDVSYNFFKNPPGQNLRNIILMVFFCIKAKLELGRRVHFELNSLRIEPHTTLHNIALREGVVKEGESLLVPRYYTNPETWYVEKLFNALLRLKGK